MKLIGIGSQIVECLRIARLIERHGELFINRVYTRREIRFCHSQRQATQHFAARWAAKEAVLRALGIRFRKGMSWSDIEIRNARGGQLAVAFRGSLREMVQQTGVRRVVLTLAHCRSHATAQAIALGDDAEPNR